MKKLFLFEGIDFSGKSTYFNFVKEKFGNRKDCFFVKEPWENAKVYPTIKKVLKKELFLPELELKKLFAKARNELFDFLLNTDYQFIFLDRSIISNYVYYFGNENFDDFCKKVGEKYKDMIINRNNVLFLFVVEKEDLKKRMSKREHLEHYEKYEILLNVQHRYICLFNNLNMEKYVFNTSKKSIKDIKNNVLKIIGRYL